MVMIIFPLLQGLGSPQAIQLESISPLTRTFSSVLKLNLICCFLLGTSEPNLFLPNLVFLFSCFGDESHGRNPDQKVAPKKQFQVK